MKVGDHFSSYEEFEEALEIYKRTVCHDYWIRDARTIENQKTRFPNTVNRASETLKYYYIRVACVKGGRTYKPKNESTQKKGAPAKRDCEATIFIRLSHCQTVLTVIEINDKHNHKPSNNYKCCCHHGDEIAQIHKKNNNTNQTESSPVSNSAIPNSQPPSQLTEMPKHIDNNKPPESSVKSSCQRWLELSEIYNSNDILSNCDLSNSNLQSACQEILELPEIQESNGHNQSNSNIDSSTLQELELTDIPHTDESLVLLEADLESYCQHEIELSDIQQDIENHVPPDFNLETCCEEALELHENSNSRPSVIATQNILQEQSQIEISYKMTLRDLTNLCGGTEIKSFAECVHLLTNTYKCKTIEALIDKCGVFKGLYFQDGRMRTYFEAFPEILIIDKTSLKINIAAATYIVMIENASGLSEIVAVCLLFDENEEALNLLTETFVKYNPSSNKVKVVMSDKEKAERRLFATHFPNAKIMISLYHTLETFNRDVSASMGITASEIKVCKFYFRQLTFSESEIEYNSVHRKMWQNIPTMVMQYFEDHWATIIDRWVKYQTFQNICLSNTTNNPLENMNAMLFSVIHQHSPLEDYIKHLFLYINSYRAGHDLKVSRMIYNHSENPPDGTSVKSLFRNFLTTFAYEIVEKQLNQTNSIEIKNVDSNTFLVISSEGLLQATCYDCECWFRKINQLPCSHIFKCREILSMPLFDTSLCLDRWTKEYSEQILKICGNDCSTEVVMFKSSEKDTSFKVTDVSSPHPLTSSDKFDIIEYEGKTMANMCSKVPTPIFHKRLNFIQNVMNLWSEGKDVELHEHFTLLFKKRMFKMKKPIKPPKKLKHFKKVRK